jgi:hypothetical protein
MGAHCLGASHPLVSGYRGPWLKTVTAFNNEYFARLVTDFDGNYVNTTVSDEVWQWENKDHEMMQPADRALIVDDAMRAHVETYASDSVVFYRDFSIAYQKLQELGIDLSGSEYVNLAFESGTCPAGEENVAKTLAFTPKFTVTYLVDKEASTIDFKVTTKHEVCLKCIT